MKQLDLRVYPREEIADVLSVNIKDSSHFKRNIENKLSKWGYGYQYKTAEVTITSQPDTPEKRLAEILCRGFGLDIQVCAIQFACFIAAFTDIEGFCTMPWEEKANLYYRQYGYCVDERTLRNWCASLIKNGIVAKFPSSVAWRTDVIQGVKHRSLVQADECQRVQDYFNRRRELFKEHYGLFKTSGTEKTARTIAWKETYKALWSEFSCCYYYCKHFTLTAFSDEVKEDLMQIYELVREIKESVDAEKNKCCPPTKEEFDRQWGICSAPFIKLE